MNAPTRTFNSILNQAIIDQAYEEHPISTACEWGGIFRDDAGAFVKMDSILAVIDRGVVPDPHQSGRQYFTHVDGATGAGQDSFTGAIGHVDHGIAIVDAIYGRRPPFSPSATIAELSGLLREYRLGAVTGDRFAKGFVSELFRDNRITYVESDESTSDTVINSQRCLLLDNKRLISQLAMLERRPSKTGARDLVTHPNGAR